MITLVHLSDIHFSPRDDLSQLDLDQHIRRALIDDLATKPAEGADYDAVLITGDVAFGGKEVDYKKAQDWLESVFARTNVSPTAVFTVPGNHDVDRDYVEPDLPLWDSHARLRQTADPVVWRDAIAKQLQRDPLHSMLAPLKSYNDFAQRYDCRTIPDKLAWCRIFEKKLDDGRLVRLHGLNSVIVSDQADAPGNLLVSEFQTAHFERTPGVVDVVMCHHPPEWLLDKAPLRDALRTFAPVALFGHEHSTRIEPTAKQVQLFAGAVQPSRRDPGWLPTYHIVQVRAATGPDFPRLVVRVHTREFDKQNYVFKPRRNERDEPVEEHALQLSKWEPPKVAQKIEVAPDTQSDICSGVAKAMPSIETDMPTPVEIAQRELLVHFFRLKTPDRYAAAHEAGLLRDGDDALAPQAMWAEVFRRAGGEPRGLAKFWSAVASRTPALQGARNPFGE